jgi:hypothetical protein
MWEKLLYIKEWLGMTFGYQVTHIFINRIANKDASNSDVTSGLPCNPFFWDSILY